MTDAELWDLTDASGRRIGRTHRRGSPGFPVGRFHVVVGTCAVRADGLVLMSRRAAAKDYPLTWEFAAGSVLAGEESATGAVRELREETGVIVRPSALTLAGRVTEPSALFDLYVARDLESAEVRIDPDEVAEAEWVALEEAERRWRAGLMAAPWDARLTQLWPQVVRLARE